MKLIIHKIISVLIIICVLILIFILNTGCAKKAYSFNNDVENIVSVEIVDADNSKNFEVKMKLSDNQVKEFLEKFQEIKFGKIIFGDPLTVHGIAFKITYDTGDYEIITNSWSEYVKDDSCYFLYTYCDEEEFGELVDDFLSITG